MYLLSVICPPQPAQHKVPVGDMINDPRTNIVGDQETILSLKTTKYRGIETTSTASGSDGQVTHRSGRGAGCPRSGASTEFLNFDLYLLLVLLISQRV